MTRGRFTALGAWLIAPMLVTGCLQTSLYPLVRPADSIFDERLVGKWTCGSEAWSITPETEDLDGVPFRHYKVEIAKGDKVGTLQAWVGRLGNTPFINFFPDDPAPSALLGRHFVPTHTFGRFRVSPDTVLLDMLESDWIAEAAKDGRISLGVKGWEEDGWLLTAPTEKLQAFALAHANDDDAFGAHIQLDRPGGQQATSPSSATRTCYT